MTRGLMTATREMLSWAGCSQHSESAGLTASYSVIHVLYIILQWPSLTPAEARYRSYITRLQALKHVARSSPRLGITNVTHPWP